MNRLNRLKLVTRVVALVDLSRSRRYRPTVESLAQSHGVTTRTIYRDFEALREAGIRVPARYVEEA